MLAIRLQRLGRKKMPVYRVAVQESHRHPTSGRVVAYVGTYDPHAKKTTFNLEKVDFYLKNGAHPSPRVVRLMEGEKIVLPSWVKTNSAKQGTIRNPEKLRKNQPKAEAAAEAPAEEAATEASTEE